MNTLEMLTEKWPIGWALRLLDPTSLFKKYLTEYMEKTNKDLRIEALVRQLLVEIGENPNREGLLGTPDRVCRMFKELYRGYDPKQAPKITTFDNGKDGIVYDNMVVDSGDFVSSCEHHMAFFWGKYWFAYIPNPNGKILGLSKIARVVDYCAAR